jgi:membrane protease subunit HflC
MKKSRIVLGIILVLIVGFFASGTYIISEDEVGVVKAFGKITKVIVNTKDIEKVQANLKIKDREDIIIIGDKGLHFKIPFVENVQKYDSKYLTYMSKKETINTKDKRSLDIQMYAQYRIVDSVRFNLAVVEERRANSVMDQRLYPVVIHSANTLNFNEFFEKDMLEKLITEKLEEVNKELISEFGIYVTDVGINRKTFPGSNISSIETKMSKQIEKESEKLIAEGDSAYQKEKAKTDRKRKEILADAIEQAAITKAQADAGAVKIYQESLKKDLEFYKFIQRMDIYKNLKDTTIFLDKNNDLLEYINGYGK